MCSSRGASCSAGPYPHPSVRADLQRSGAVRSRPMEMHFATVWESLADAIGDEPAVVHGDVRRTWREYDDRAARLASAFTAAGLEPGRPGRHC